MEFIMALVLASCANPLVLLLILILYLFLICLYLILVLESFLFSYLVFLLFVSGLIMLLMYFCSIILSEKYLILSNSFLIFIFFFIVLYSEGALLGCSELDQSKKLMYFEFYELLKYSLVPYMIYSLFYIGYLLICLLAVYEIVSRCGGPLRMKI